MKGRTRPKKRMQKGYMKCAAMKETPSIPVRITSSIQTWFLHDRIVSLVQRVEDLIQRYGTTEEIKNRIRLNESMVFAIEKKIADSMTVDLDSAIQRIQTLFP